MLEIIFTAAITVSLFSLIGVALLAVNKDLTRKLLVFLVAFAVGAMIGGALFHLLPEALLEMEMMLVFTFLFAGFMLFFIIEKFLHWRHCHEEECEVHREKCSGKKIMPAAYLNLIGDGVHNFMDGVVIAASFIAGIPVGVASTIAIALHEIPQELGDFAVLVHSGIAPRNALFYNLLTGLIAVAGGVAGYFFLTSIIGLTPYLLALSAGGFLYIAAVDLVPELHKERKLVISVVQFAAIVFGVALMYYMKVVLGG